jgi:BMFP domain-containing protein YqiC
MCRCAMHFMPGRRQAINKRFRDCYRRLAEFLILLETVLKSSLAASIKQLDLVVREEFRTD